MIETRLSKTYGGVAALEEVTFTAAPGRVTGFLGLNGSGKTTTLRMLLGLSRPTAGEALINGVRYRDLRHPLREVGAVLEQGVEPPRPDRARAICSPRRCWPAPAGRGSTSCSSTSGWPTPRGSGPGTTRSACGSGWRWRPRCSASRRCWCWTSRPTASTRPASPGCAACCGRTPRPAAPCCSPATCWPSWPSWSTTW